ncbi:hypothetical protein SLS62_007234 [Diatrype stigma]|uniref:Uncharacterized protein n=1 Tax=Diatrype stigma TaxID=117547 RepID=A0AAN9UR84_9PEZI
MSRQQPPPPFNKPSIMSHQTTTQQRPSQLDLAAAAAINTTPAAATSPHLEQDAARAMSRTNSWKPASGSFQRRPSYDMEDRKRDLQMTGVSAVQEEPGFSERRAGA